MVASGDHPRADDTTHNCSTCVSRFGSERSDGLYDYTTPFQSRERAAPVQAPVCSVFTLVHQFTPHRLFPSFFSGEIEEGKIYM
jgi:hypothetical protein